MMPCEVIRDLMPLYLDECCSDKSRLLVEEHLAECSACRKLMEEMQGEFVWNLGADSGEDETTEKAYDAKDENNAEGKNNEKEKEIEENLAEKRLLKNSKEALKKEAKKEVKRDFIGKGAVVSICLNLAWIAVLLYQFYQFNISGAIPAIYGENDIGFYSFYRVSYGIVIICFLTLATILEILYLRSKKKGKPNEFAWVITVLWVMMTTVFLVVVGALMIFILLFDKML